MTIECTCKVFHAFLRLLIFKLFSTIAEKQAMNALLALGYLFIASFYFNFSFWCVFVSCIYRYFYFLFCEIINNFLLAFAHATRWPHNVFYIATWRHINNLNKHCIVHGAQRACFTYEYICLLHDAYMESVYLHENWVLVVKWSSLIKAITILW